MDAVWVPCPCCDEHWCNLHDMHACDCPCPPIDEWETDPYGVVDRLDEEPDRAQE